MKTAFSLIELLVVLAIIAMLAAIAIPAYTQYITRARVANAVSLLSTKMQELSLYYQKNGTWPANVTFLGTTAASGWWAVSQNSNNFTYLTYGASTDGKAASIGAQLSTSVVGTNNSFAIIVREVNGSMQNVCGATWYSGANIPSYYLPGTCQCANMSAYWNTGTGC